MHKTKLHILYCSTWMAMETAAAQTNTHSFSIKMSVSGNKANSSQAHTWIRLSSIRWLPWNSPRFFGPSANGPKTIHKMPFQKFNNQQRALPSSSPWPSRDLHNIISKHSLWSQPRPPTADHPPAPRKCRHSLDLDFRLGIKYLTAAESQDLPATSSPIYKHKFIQRN